MTYGIYQISIKLDTFHKAEVTGKKIQDNIELHSAISTTNTWDLYIQKSEAYDNITITNLHKGLYSKHIQLEWIDQTVTSLPVGYITSHPETFPPSAHDHNNYLLLTGGTLTNDTLGVLEINRPSNLTSAIKFSNKVGILGYIGMNTVDGSLNRIAATLDSNGNSKIYTMLDSNNVGKYALPISGGTITGDVVFSKATFAPLIIERTTGEAASIGFKNTNGILGYIGMTLNPNEGLIRFTADNSTAYTILDSGNYKTYCIPASNNPLTVVSYSSNSSSSGITKTITIKGEFYKESTAFYLQDLIRFNIFRVNTTGTTYGSGAYSYGAFNLANNDIWMDSTGETILSKISSSIDDSTGTSGIVERTITLKLTLGSYGWFNIEYNSSKYEVTIV